ncbi:MAG: TrkA family potassium uptake protein [Ignavibacteriae bacterium]|nr:MAG: TrkA family potassium uptake protein [Ignavibacteriota bacterium]
MKHFVIIGLGRFGYHLSTSLYRLGNQVLVIDLDKRVIDSIKDLVTEAVIGDAKDIKVLSDFIDDSIDTVVVATGASIEMSVLTVLNLKNLGVKHIVAKAKSEDHGRILRSLDVNEVIYPEKDSAYRLAEEMSISSLVAHIPLAPDYSIVEIVTPEKFYGKSLEELQIRKKYGVNVIAIKDVLYDKFDVIPDSSKKLPPDSVMLIVGKTDEVVNLNF